jgi:hypothetical protein
MGRIAIITMLAVVGLFCVFRVIGGQSDPKNTPAVSTPTTRKVEQFATRIRIPTSAPTVRTGLRDIHGNEIQATCVACHTTRPANPANATAGDLDEFHTGLTLRHGTLVCLSCHNPDDYGALRLASGAKVQFANVMQLCAQCHGPQYRDYQHGAHGGMLGYWDLSRGPRMRNNCVNCHDPHHPAYGRVIPAAPPADRFLEKKHE